MTIVKDSGSSTMKERKDNINDSHSKIFQDKEVLLISRNEMMIRIKLVNENSRRMKEKNLLLLLTLPHILKLLYCM